MDTGMNHVPGQKEEMPEELTMTLNLSNFLRVFIYYFQNVTNLRRLAPQNVNPLIYIIYNIRLVLGTWVVGRVGM